MFIREKIKKNKGSDKEYRYYELVESVRTEKGPRQRLLLNLGGLDIDKTRLPLLAAAISDIICGQQTLIQPEPDIKLLADFFAHDLLQKCERHGRPSPVDDYEDIRISSVKPQRPRSLGSEYVSLSFLEHLQLDIFFRSLGFTQRQVEIACLLIIGRLTSPGSERHTYHWGKQSSSLDELLSTDFTSLSLNSLYAVSDSLVHHQDQIERHLRKRERSVFGLPETLILYDLTNTYFEGEAADNPKAKFGRSKEKRSDCRLVTLGLVLDGQGFPKTSRVFAGNQSEPETLVDMIEKLENAQSDNGLSKETSVQSSDNQTKKTVVIDAGIATEETLSEVRKSYHYICVSRKKHDLPVDISAFRTIRETKESQIDVYLSSSSDDVFLFCHSKGKRQKEQGIRGRLQQRYEEELSRIKASLQKKGGTKKYEKVLERLGRAKERYKKIAQYYTVHVEERNGYATQVTWELSKQQQADNAFSGNYVLRTDRTDLTDEEIWQIYTMLLDVEDAFRTMKSELGIRPNFHQKEHRSDGHLFITVLAYHILHSIRVCLKDHGIRDRWSTLRQRLRTVERITTCMRNKKGKMIYVRSCSEPEPFHKMIFDALNLSHCPLKDTTFSFSK
jgi:transposase